MSEDFFNMMTGNRIAFCSTYNDVEISIFPQGREHYYITLNNQGYIEDVTKASESNEFKTITFDWSPDEKDRLQREISILWFRFSTQTTKETKKTRKDFYIDGFFNHVLASEYLLKSYYFARINGSVAIYFDGRYIHDFESSNCIVWAIMMKIKDTNIKDRREIVDYISIHPNIPILKENNQYILTPNGLLDLNELEIIEPTPNLAILRKIPTAYNENIIEWGLKEEFDKMINEIFCYDESLKNLFFECVGLSLIPETKRREAFYLKGDGNNGKGVMMNLLKETVGKYNVTSASFKKLGTPFGLAMLIDGMININGEMSKNYSGQDLDIFKQLTGGDLLEINKKYKNAYSQVYTGRLWLLSNFMLNVSDGSQAMMDRLICIPFNAKFDNNIHWKTIREPMLKSPEAKQYFLYLAIQGLKRYRTQNGFTYNQQSELLKLQNKEFNNPVYSFLLMMQEQNKPYLASDGISNNELYRYFVTWWIEEGLGKVILAKKNFYQSMSDLGYEISKSPVWCPKLNKGIRGFMYTK